MPHPRDFSCRLLALDVDGTLLNSRGELTERTRAALRTAATRGIHLVVATGRRYRRTLPLVEPLGIEVPLVTHSGALIKDAQNHRTLFRATLEPELTAAVLAKLDRLGYQAIVYQDRFEEGIDYLTPARRSEQLEFNEYLELNRGFKVVCPDLVQSPPGDVFAMCTLGSRDAMLGVEDELHRAFPNRLCIHVLKSPRYHGELCEIMRADATKWSAVQWLARQWGIASEEICAIGDDVNDVAMLQGAGLGIAMGHAPEAVRAAADYVTEEHDNDGLAVVAEQLIRDQGSGIRKKGLGIREQGRGS